MSRDGWRKKASEDDGWGGRVRVLFFIKMFIIDIKKASSCFFYSDVLLFFLAAPVNTVKYYFYCYFNLFFDFHITIHYLSTS